MEAHEVCKLYKRYGIVDSSIFPRECRHPNVVLYLGLSRAPEPDCRIFIISEFIDNGEHLRFERATS
jgi:hypothetical protein